MHTVEDGSGDVGEKEVSGSVLAVKGFGLLYPVTCWLSPHLGCDDKQKSLNDGAPAKVWLKRMPLIKVIPDVVGQLFDNENSNNKNARKIYVYIVPCDTGEGRGQTELIARAFRPVPGSTVVLLQKKDFYDPSQVAGDTVTIDRLAAVRGSAEASGYPALVFDANESSMTYTAASSTGRVLGGGVGAGLSVRLAAASGAGVAHKVTRESLAKRVAAIAKGDGGTPPLPAFAVGEEAVVADLVVEVSLKVRAVVSEWLCTVARSVKDNDSDIDVDGDGALRLKRNRDRTVHITGVDATMVATLLRPCSEGISVATRRASFAGLDDGVLSHKVNCNMYVKHVGVGAALETHIRARRDGEQAEELGGMIGQRVAKWFPVGDGDIQLFRGAVLSFRPAPRGGTCEFVVLYDDGFRERLTSEYMFELLENYQDNGEKDLEEDYKPRFITNPDAQPVLKKACPLKKSILSKNTARNGYDTCSASTNHEKGEDGIEPVGTLVVNDKKSAALLEKDMSKAACENAEKTNKFSSEQKRYEEEITVSSDNDKSGDTSDSGNALHKTVSSIKNASLSSSSAPVSTSSSEGKKNVLESAVGTKRKYPTKKITERKKSININRPDIDSTKEKVEASSQLSPGKKHEKEASADTTTPLGTPPTKSENEEHGTPLSSLLDEHKTATLKENHQTEMPPLSPIKEKKIISIGNKKLDKKGTEIGNNKKKQTEETPLLLTAAGNLQSTIPAGTLDEKTEREQQQDSLLGLSSKNKNDVKESLTACDPTNAVMDDRIANYFADDLYFGKITKIIEKGAKRGQPAYWRITYDDGDVEDLNRSELKRALILYEEKKMEDTKRSACTI